MSLARDLELARRAKRSGANYSLRIVRQARKSGLKISLAFALVNQESGFKNVFGHDPAPNGGTNDAMGKKVTRSRYRQYKRRRGSSGKGGMQGVGPCQLTWWEFQDMADRRGGCHVPKHNISVSFDHLAHLIAMHGEKKGLAAYNGSGAAADAYAKAVLAKAHAWHLVLT